MHGSVGSSCAVADVRADSATIWSATQSAYPTRDTTAALLGLQPERVRVVYVRGSGCYGINGADTVTYDAALLSHAVGKPVRVQLSRADEMAWENFGPRS
jgi:CO/xanthine dehydrogenase Mo-binding subunit